MRVYQWFLKKIEEPLKGIYILIGVFTVINFSLGVFDEYIKINYPNETITIVNETAKASGGINDRSGAESSSDREEVSGTPTVDERIRDIADQKGFSEVDKLIKVLKCESSLRYDEIVDGDYKNYSINPKNNSYDRGFAQWSRKYNPHISDECAFSLTCSVEAMIDDVNKSGWGKWNASKGCWGNQ